jgi:hypothetical protein
MTPTTVITDAELAVVARVAGREGWSDLSAPPEEHGPRSLEEGRAVARFAAAVPGARGPRGRSARATRVRARLALVVLTVGVLGACWWVSPTRTAIGLIGAGLFSLIALRRTTRRAEDGPRPPRRSPFSGGLRTR